MNKQKLFRYSGSAASRRFRWKMLHMLASRFYLLLLITIGLILSGWGYKGHKKISGNSSACYPAQVAFLKPNWSSIVTLHASDADNRKDTDPDESPRHYIDIDNYQEFLQNGQISEIFDSVVEWHGLSWVIDQGILPWATSTTFDSLRNCFQRGDWNKSALFAADLGHYVADGYDPLHITRNYDGQYTNQSGIHSRYESKMISKYENQILYPSDTVTPIADVRGYIFSYLYQNYRFVDSILLADQQARTSAGNVTSDAYYQALWSISGDFTIDLFRRASESLAALIYTAWVQAGSPVMYPNAVPDAGDLTRTRLYQNFPNPFRDVTRIPIGIRHNNTFVSLKIYDALGNLKATLLNEILETGDQEIKWDGGEVPGGVYYIVLKADDWTETKKIVRMK